MDTPRNAIRAVTCILAIQFSPLMAMRANAQEPQMRRVEPLPPPAAGTNQTQILEPRAVGEAGETIDLGPQVALRRRARPVLFQLYSDSQYLFDSNVALTDSHPVSDSLFFQTLGAAFTPPAWAQISAAIYVRQQFIRYNAQSVLDFDAQTAGLSLSRPVEDWFTLYGGFAASRLYTRQDEHEFEKQFDTQCGLWRNEPLGQRFAAYYGYQLDWLPTAPSALTEVDNALYGGINWRLLDQVTAQLLYRFRVRDYLQDNRTDLDHLVSLAVTYAFNRYVSLRAYATYGENNSNKHELSYSVVNAGGGLNLSARF